MATANSVQLSIVIPVYRAAGHLPALVERLIPVLDAAGMAYEVILVDDGSPDESWKVMAQLRAQNPRLLCLQLMRNYGQHNATMAGLRRARGDFIVTMDDDLQHPPEEMPKLLDAIRSGDLDLVYGCYEAKQHSPWRNWGSGLVRSFYRIVFRSSIDTTSFRVMRRGLLRCIADYRLNYTYIDGLLAWNTQRIGQVLVKHSARSQGRSGYSLGKLIVLALNLFTNFSLLPLQIASAVGVLTATTGLLVAIYYLVQFFLAHITVPGYASTITAILVLGGIQLLALGIMGEYLGRLHLNVNRKPQYFEREAIGFEEPGESEASGDRR